MATINEIKQQAAAVKNATQVGENTAERVGGALAGLADIAEQQDSKLSDLPMQKVNSVAKYISAIVDKKNRIIESIDENGNKDININVRLNGNVSGNAIDEIINKIKKEISQIAILAKNEKIVKATIDANNKILESIDVYGTKDVYIPLHLHSTFKTENEEVNTIVNKDFYKIIADKNKHILYGITSSGDFFIGGNIINTKFNKVVSQNDKNRGELCKLSNPIMESFSHINKEHETIKEIKPFGTKPYQRCGTCLVAPNGNILACTPIRTGYSDSDSAYIALSIITDGIAGEEKKIFNEDGYVYADPSFVVDTTGSHGVKNRIYLFVGKYTAGTDFVDSTREQVDCLYKYSDDNGENWSEAISLKEKWNNNTFIAVIPSPCNGIQASDGTLYIPTFISTGDKRVSASGLIVKRINSDWFFTNSANDSTSVDSDNESTVYEDNNNNIMLNCRTSSKTKRNLYQFNGNTFDKKEFLFDPVVGCSGSIVKTKIYGYTVFLMSFPDASNRGDYKKGSSYERTRDRTTIWCSIDGFTWIRVYRLKEDIGSNNGYSVISEYNGKIAVYYENEQSSGGCSIQDISIIKDLIYKTISTMLDRTTEDKLQYIINNNLK